MPESHRFIEFCRSLRGVTEDMKWGDNLVFSVGGKMFALFNLPGPDEKPFSLKTDPENFEALVNLPGIEPAPYMARIHWVSFTRQDALPADEVQAMLAEAHRMAASTLSKKKRAALGFDF